MRYGDQGGFKPRPLGRGLLDIRVPQRNLLRFKPRPLGRGLLEETIQMTVSLYFIIHLFCTKVKPFQ